MQGGGGRATLKVMSPLAPSLRRLAAAQLLGLFGFPVLAAPAPPVPPWTAELGHDHPLAGRIWLVAEHRFITADELVTLAAKAHWVMLGEKHDDADHHALQAYLLRRLIAAGRHPVVAFEQFEADKGEAIAKYLRKRPKDAAGLGAAVGWDKTGWPDWSQYSPIAQAALDAGLPLVAANIPADEARAMARREPVPPERIAELSLDQPLLREQHKALLDEIRHGHCGMLPEHTVGSMAMAQRARDGGMARALVTAAQAGPRAGPPHARCGALRHLFPRGPGRPDRPRRLHPDVRRHLVHRPRRRRRPLRPDGGTDAQAEIGGYPEGFPGRDADQPQRHRGTEISQRSINTAWSII